MFTTWNTKLLEENIRDTLQDIDTGKDFLEIIPEAQSIKIKVTNGVTPS